MMSSTKKSEIIDHLIREACAWIQRALVDFIDRDMETDRVSQLGFMLLRVGDVFPEKYPQKKEIVPALFEHIMRKQRKDGGWKDVEETMWALAVLKYYKGNIKVLNDGCGWLKKQKNSCGGWGRSDRDFSRIPVTCRIAILHGDLCDRDDFEWILSELYEEVLDEKNDFFLSYKNALPIIAFRMNNLKIPSKNQLYKLLIKEQNDDGGYAPWRNHPIGSDIVSSAYALMAFSQEKEYKAKVDSIINWMYKTQLPDGSWPYHFIDHGVSTGLWALIETKRVG